MQALFYFSPNGKIYHFLVSKRKVFTHFPKTLTLYIRQKWLKPLSNLEFLLIQQAIE